MPSLRRTPPLSSCCFFPSFSLFHLPLSFCLSSAHTEPPETVISLDQKVLPRTFLTGLAGTVSPVLAQGHVSIPGGFLPCLQLSSLFPATKTGGNREQGLLISGTDFPTCWPGPAACGPSQLRLPLTMPAALVNYHFKEPTDRSDRREPMARESGPGRGWQPGGGPDSD